MHYSDKGSSDNPDAFKLDMASIYDKGLLTAVREHVVNYYKELFLTKHRCWSYEQEYRWLVRCPEEVLVPIETSIRGMLVGVDCPQMDRGRLIQISQKLGIEVGLMTWRNGIGQPFFGGLYAPPGVSRTALGL